MKNTIDQQIIEVTNPELNIVEIANENGNPMDHANQSDRLTLESGIGGLCTGCGCCMQNALTWR